MNNLGVYIHIPFCVKKCNYCDFNSTDTGSAMIEPYVDALIGEIGAFSMGEFSVDTVFFGGGTPTVIEPSVLGRILGAVSDKFYITSDCEITTECNPGTVKDFSGLKSAGFNRLSIGLQSSCNKELARLGRIHTFEEFLKSYDSARKVFSNINLDLMHSLPDQTIEQWSNTLTKIKALDPEHISAYALKVEEGTPFGNMTLNLPDEEVDRQMYRLVDDILTNHARYEISNLAKQDMECRHNLKYWGRLPYAGFGAGAHSNIGDKRYSNVSGISEYINAKDKIAESITLSELDAMSEFIFLGLRLTKGVPVKEFESNFGTDIRAVFGEAIDKHLRLATIKQEGGRLVLTNYGVDVSNVVLSEFLH